MQGKGKFPAYGIATALLIVGIVVVANLVSRSVFHRFDLTQGKVFSLNPASRKIVGGLEDEFLVKAYFSKNLPAPYNANAKYVQDQLDEYKAYGKGRFKYTFMDPGDDQKLEAETQKYRIPPVQVQVVEHDQFQAKKAYMGLVFLYQDRQESIPVVDNTSGLEYEITTIMKKLSSSSKELPGVGFLTGHDEPGLDQMQRVHQLLAKQYNVKPVSVAKGAKVPDDVQVLVIASPRKDFANWEKYAIDQFIMRGGKVAFLVDKVDANLQYQQAMPVRMHLDDWFENYGFRVNDNLVGDLQNPGLLTISQQEGSFQMMSQVPYPFIPSLRDLDKTNVMVKDLQRVSLYFASTIDTSAAKGKGLAVEPLVRTSPRTMLQEKTYNINPLQRWKAEDFDKGQQVVAAILHGSFTSAFKDKPVPAASDSAGAAPAASAGPTLAKSPETRLVVIGDGEFFEDQKGGGDRDNLVFFQNLVDWLAQDEALIAIRSREATDRPLAPVSEPKRHFVKYASMLGGPALVILIGLVAWQVRRRRKIEI